MKKTKIVKILTILSIILLIVFIIKTIIDYKNYSLTTSAPFSLNIYFNGTCFLIPSLILFIVSNILKNKK